MKSRTSNDASAAPSFASPRNGFSMRSEIPAPWGTSESGLVTRRPPTNTSPRTIVSSGFAIVSSSGGEGIPRLAGGPPGRVAIVYDLFDDDPLVLSRRAWLRILDECSQGGGTGSPPCDFALVSPPQGAEFHSTAATPTFWWRQGPYDRFRVEFSATVDFSKRRVLSRQNLVPGAIWTPNAAKWRSVKALAPTGQPIYWRVVGKPGGSSRRTTTPQTFWFTIV